jgi:3-dehydrosphinganine reductase
VAAINLGYSYMNLSGKKSLITGGSSGIGLALACKLAAQGAHVWILARDPVRLDCAREEILAVRASASQHVGVIQADIANYPQISASLAEFTAKHGAPDLLFNSAGVTHPGKFIEQDLSIFRRMMEINYFGSLHVIKILLPAMVERGTGHVVNISSVVGYLGMYGYAAYGASKFAVRGLSDSLRSELAEHGIRVSVVFPPDTQTPQLEFEEPLKPPILRELDKGNKILSADAVAESILRGVARGSYVITPGFDSTLYYHLTNFFGLVYPVMDIMVAQARRVLRKTNGNGFTKDNNGHQNKGDPDQV